MGYLLIQIYLRGPGMTDKLHFYYEGRKEQVLAAFQENLYLTRPVYEKLIQNMDIGELFDKFLDEFNYTYTTIPYAGGDEGRMTAFYELGAGVLAVGRVLRANNYSKEIINQLMRATFLAKLLNTPKEQRLAIGQQFMSDENRRYVESESKRSQKRIYPEDFVYKFIEGEPNSPDSFEFGIDYTECGFCKLCEKTGDEDLLPNFCSVDQEFYALRGINLIRTTTLASGGSRCDFRFAASLELQNFKKIT